MSQNIRSQLSVLVEKLQKETADAQLAFAQRDAIQILKVHSTTLDRTLKACQSFLDEWTNVLIPLKGSSLQEEEEICLKFEVNGESPFVAMENASSAQIAIDIHVKLTEAQFQPMTFKCASMARIFGHSSAPVFKCKAMERAFPQKSDATRCAFENSNSDLHIEIVHNSIQFVCLNLSERDCLNLNSKGCRSASNSFQMSKPTAQWKTEQAKLFLQFH